MAALQPINRATLTDRVEEQLRSFIREARLVPGDALPSEQELGRILGVSRTSLREALSRLRAFGLLSSRRRRGLLVAKPDVFAGMQRVFDALLPDAEEHAVFAELRRVIETGMADLVMARQMPADLANLHDIVEAMRSATSQVARLDLDVRFHQQLLSMTGNPAIIRLGGLLRYDLNRKAGREAARHSTISPAEFLARHEALLDALHSNNFDVARQAFRQHFLPDLNPPDLA